MEVGSRSKIGIQRVKIGRPLQRPACKSSFITEITKNYDKINICQKRNHFLKQLDLD